MPIAALAGCSSSGGPPASPLEPIPWPIGTYTLEARVQYQDDNEYGSRTVRDDYFADLNIAPGGSLALVNPNGICQDLTRQEIDVDLAMRRKTFRCGDFTYVVQPSGSTIRGQLIATVSERIRRRGACIRYRPAAMDGARQCAEYRWTVSSRRTRKRARLTIIPRP